MSLLLLPTPLYSACRACRYATPQLKFAKINVARYQELADEFRIDTSGSSWQLPTLILFTNGEEEKRLPDFSADGKVIKTILDKPGIVAVFGLDSQDRKGNPKKRGGKPTADKSA